MKPAPDVALSDVEWRVDSDPYDRDGKKICRYVPHIDARVAARLLDEWVGPENWEDRYEPCTLVGKEALWCELSVKIGDAPWVTKRDVGVPSNFEAQKGLVSDAFKRAASVKWGVGRNVYSLPTLWAPCDVGGNGKARANKDTKPELMRQLKARGFALVVAKVEGEP